MSRANEIVIGVVAAALLLSTFRRAVFRNGVRQRHGKACDFVWAGPTEPRFIGQGTDRTRGATPEVVTVVVGVGIWEFVVEREGWFYDGILREKRRPFDRGDVLPLDVDGSIVDPYEEEDE